MLGSHKLDNIPGNSGGFCEEIKTFQNGSQTSPLA